MIPSATDDVRRHLLTGEHIVWRGAPFPGLMFQPMDAFLIPFSLLWGGFAILWNAGVWLVEAPIFLRLWGLPFLAVGLYFIFGRFLFDMRIRRRLVYLVTDRRILILKRSGAIQARSLDIKRLPIIELHERADGSGTIRFGQSPGMFGGNNNGMWAPSSDPTPQFLRIVDVRRVYELIQKHAD